MAVCWPGWVGSIGSSVSPRIRPKCAEQLRTGVLVKGGTTVWIKVVGADIVQRMVVR